jgi:hypothetical protein
MFDGPVQRDTAAAAKHGPDLRIVEVSTGALNRKF